LHKTSNSSIYVFGEFYHGVRKDEAQRGAEDFEYCIKPANLQSMFGRFYHGVRKDEAQRGTEDFEYCTKINKSSIDVFGKFYHGVRKDVAQRKHKDF
jgi:hypothetical protein